jgi:hypothetical protein
VTPETLTHNSAHSFGVDNPFHVSHRIEMTAESLRILRCRKCREDVTCWSRKPLADASRTSGGRGGRAPVQTRRSEGGRRSTEFHRVRFRCPGRHNGDRRGLRYDTPRLRS